jgi:glutamine phosphoribosylpyrophosphate amidotransferase
MKNFVCASETCALDAVGAQYVRDICQAKLFIPAIQKRFKKLFGEKRL